MPTHAEQRLLPYRPEQLYELVAGVDRYPEFLPWCKAARITRREGDVFYADLVIAFKVFRERFSSKVSLHPQTKIDVEYINGPFRYLNNHWKFAAHERGCMVDFHVDFEFRSRLLQAAIGVVQLNQLGEFLEKRATLAAVYREHLPEDVFALPTVPDGRTHVYYRFVVRLPKGLQSADDFAGYLSRLAHRGVHCRKPVFRPLHRYLELSDFPASDEVDAAAISLPIHPSLNEDAVRQVAEILQEELR